MIGNGKWKMDNGNVKWKFNKRFCRVKRKKIKNDATDNQKARRKIRKQQEFDIDRG